MATTTTMTTTTGAASSALDLADPPEGAEIRRQVEFYFSDDNLPTDIHLLQCCGGRENEPVSISRICGFKKMRVYKPKSLVAEALRHSAFLEITEDGKRVKRKIPLQGLCKLDPEFYQEGINHDPKAPESRSKPEKFSDLASPNDRHPQVKKVYPEGMTKNMMKPTGFEPTYIEPPITPDEAADEDYMFDSDNSLRDRIELGIQMFKEKRRMHEMYALVFNKLMRFGGVESSQRSYQGVDYKDQSEMDKPSKIRAAVTHTIPEDRDEEDKWVVDFVGVLKAFLSSWYPAHYGYSEQTIRHACQVPRSFYNFLRYHRVCTEYNGQLVEALEICDIAEKELPKVSAAGATLPGDFNKAASALFGGAHAGLFAGDKSWAAGMETVGFNVDQIGIRKQEARLKFGAGLAILGSDEQAAWLDSQHSETLEHISVGLEVIDIQLPTKEVRALYEEESKRSEHKVGGQLEPLGKLICQTWHADDCDEWDLPKDKAKYPRGKPLRAEIGRKFEFWVEESVLENCFVGLKLDASVLTLQGGLTILDEVRETACSFFTFLPNEICMERKPREVTWLPKGLPEYEEPEPAMALEEKKDGAAGQIEAGEGAEGTEGKVKPDDDGNMSDFDGDDDE